MLTGQSPYGTEKRTTAELMRVVCQDQPERPSAKRGEMKGDSDNIVLMALRKEPERRYASAQQLSEDLTRHLELLPVRARGNDFRYTASMFIRRNLLASGALVLIVASLVVGMVTTARAEARAERRFEDVRQMAHSFVFDYYDAIETLPGATPVRHKLVQEALRYLDRLSGEADSDSLKLELVQAYVKISRVQGNTYESNLGDGPGALASVRKAVAIGDPLLRHDQSAGTFGALAGAYLDQAELLHGTNDLDSADKAYSRALQLAQSAVKLNPNNPDLLLQLIRTERHMGDLYGAGGVANLGRTQQAADIYRQASVDGERLLKAYPKLPAAHINLFDSYLATASVASTMGKHDQSEQVYRKALDMIRAISAAHPDNANDRLEVAGTSILAREFMQASKPAQALPYFKEAESTVEALCRQDPQNELYKRNLSVTEVHIGNALMKEGDPRSALAYFSKASKLSESLMTGPSQPAEILNDMALAERKLGQAYLDMNESRQAQVHADKSLKILDGLAVKSKDANLMASLARCETLNGQIMLKQGNGTAAILYFEKAQRHFADLAKADTANAAIRVELAASEALLASHAPNGVIH